jgi:glycosyltransferase involved in cell wall biosynthesis
MRVSVIATVYNEYASIQRLLDSLAAQTRRPDEVVICDGGSTDGTAELVEAYARRQPPSLPNLRLIVEPGANISRGRNLAIAAAAGPLIAATDAGVRLEPTWLAQLVAPWDEAEAKGHEAPLAAAGFFVADAEGVFQKAMAATVLPLLDEINPHRFLPSSRSVAFTKDAWARAGGYPEWLDYCEDLLFDFAVNAQRPERPTAFAWAPAAIVHFRPRTSLRAFWRQYYHYARGDGKADLWRKRHAIRYATYLVVLPALLGHAFFGVFARWLGLLGLLAGIALYCRRPWQRLRTLRRDLTGAQQLAAAALVPVIRVVGDVAKMVGYPVGLWWRVKNKARIGEESGVAERTGRGD